MSQRALPDEDYLLTEDEAAEVLGVKAKWLRRTRRSPSRKHQGPPSVRVGHTIIRYRLTDLRAWIAGRVQGSGK